MNWPVLTIALLLWLVIGVVVALAVGRILSHGQSEEQDEHESSVLAFFIKYFHKNDPTSRGTPDSGKHDANASLTHEGPRTITR